MVREAILLPQLDPATLGNGDLPMEWRDPTSWSPPPTLAFSNKSSSMPYEVKETSNPTARANWII